MKYLLKYLVVLMLLFSVSGFVSAQESNNKNVKPTKAQRKAEKVKAKQEKQARKAELKGKKRHFMLQDKKTRKRMKKHRRRVDKHFPGDPQTYFRKDEKNYFLV
jgi:hypothetical protein